MIVAPPCFAISGIVFLALEYNTIPDCAHPYKAWCIVVKPTGPCSELLRRIVEVQAEQSKAFRETARDEMLLHDASVVMYLLHPHMFLCRRGRVWIETNRASPNRGQTRMESRCVSVQANAWVAESVETPEMLQLCVVDGVCALDSE